LQKEHDLLSLRNLLGVFVAGLGIAATFFIFKIVWQSQGEPIRIGAIIPLTGTGSHLLDLRDALVLAVEEINERGGINGRRVALIVEDSKTDPQEAVDAFKRMESSDPPLLYVSALSAISMALAPLADKHGVPLVGLVVSSPVVTKDREWVFRYFASAEYEAACMISHLNQLRVNELGILYLNDEYGLSVFDRLEQKFLETGGTVKSESFDNQMSDLNEKIERLKGAEAIYGIGYVAHLKEIFETLKETRYAGFVLGPSGTINLVGSDGIVDKVYVAAPLIYNPNNQFARRAREKFESRYAKPFFHQAAVGYDFMKLLRSLLEGRKISRENVKRFLEEGFVHPGVLGDVVHKPGDHDIVFPLYPAQLLDGAVRYRYWRTEE